MLRSLLLVCLLPASLQADPVPNTEWDRLIEETRKAWNVPGVAIVIVRGNEIVYLKGHGVRELGKEDRVTDETLFPLASCTKAFTSFLVGTLVDDGTVEWDDPVTKHLPDFRLSDPHASKLVTLRDLLAHRTGVGPHDLLWYRSPLSHDELIRRVGFLPLDKPFRGGMLYQSVMVLAAGEGVSRTAKKPWATLVRERILEPLEMKATSLDTREAASYANRAKGHRSAAEGKVNTTPEYPIELPNASGSVNSTARDLANWLIVHLNEGQFQEKQIVSGKALRTIQTPTTAIEMTEEAQKLSPETNLMSYALGWTVQDHRGEKLISHTGLIDGYRAHLTLVPKQKVGIAILANLHGTRMNLALSHSILDRLFKWEPRDWNRYYRELIESQEFAERAAEKRFERNRKRGTQTTQSLEQLAGKYQHPAYGQLQIEFKDDRLKMKWSSFDSPLEHWHFNLFRIEEGYLTGRTIEFLFDAEKRRQGVRFLDLKFEG
jgi:CubicO group peptidase (beta-lactamase class C family)